MNADNLVHLDITVPCKTYSPIALAELYVAHYCLCTKAIFNQNYSGSHLEITFGSDQTIALIEQGLNPYVMMTVFRTRFRGCKVSKGERYSHFPSNFEHEEDLIFSSMPLDIIETKVMGDLRLTQHAYDRFWERCVPEHDKPVIRSAYKSLVIALKSDHLVPVAHTDNYPLKKKLQKGIDNFNSMRVFKDPRKDIHFVIAPNQNDVSTLVTAFMRNEKHYIYYEKQSDCEKSV